MRVDVHLRSMSVCPFYLYLLKFCIWRGDDYKRISFCIICSSFLDSSICWPDYNRFYT